MVYNTEVLLEHRYIKC